jgi:hypothetical protein
MVYRGYVEQNGLPVNGTRTFRFQFHSAATGPTPLGSAVLVNNVNVSGGNFSATLAVPDAALASSTIYLAVEVGTSAANLVALNTARQRIFSTPLSMRGRFDSAFVVDGAANVRGSELALGTGGAVGTNAQQRALSVATGDTLVINNSGDFEGGVRVDSAVTVQNRLTIGTDANGSGTRSIAFSRDSGDEASAGKVAYRAFGETSLSIVGAGATAGDRRISLWDDVTVKGALRVDGRMDSKAMEQCDCEDASESVIGPNVVNVMPNNNLTVPGARYQCRGGRVLTGFTSAGVCNNEMFAVSSCLSTFRCCRPCNLDPI